MIQSFDIFNLPEVPVFVLCNPNKDKLFSMGGIYDTDLKLRYNGMSEFKFTICSKINGQTVPYFDSIKYRKLVLIEEVGYFLIDSIEEKNDGVINTKDVGCKSLEAELIYKQLSLQGTFNFYSGNPLDTTDLMHKILSYAPGWNIGYIDPDLRGKYRTFDISKNTLYNLMMTELSNTYECVFTFDTFAKTISAYTSQNATSNSDIYLSYDNLIQNINIKTITSELVTALDVTGGGSLSISTINPLGTNTIYNFTYYKTLEWMGADLIAAIDAWQLKVSNNFSTYGSTLASYKTANSELLVLKSQLDKLKSRKLSMEGVQAARMEQVPPIPMSNPYTDNSVDPPVAYPTLTAALADINSQITSKNIEIANKQASITALDNQLKSINQSLSFSTNFTTAQLMELDPYIIASSYQNENYIQTTIMTPTEIQTQAQNLYDQAVRVLAKVSQPRYEFGIDAANFIFLKEYIQFTNQLKLGCVINLEISDDTVAYPVLLEIGLSYDDPTKFTMVFSNRLRLDNSNYEFSDLFGSTNNSGINVDFNSQQWKDWTDNYQDEVSLFISSALDATTNNVVTSSDQEIIFDKNGIRGRKTLGGGLYGDEQFWMNNNVLAFTKDNWQTSSLALGRITFAVNGTQTTSYGLVADTLVGRMLIGNSLYVSNANNTFTVDGSGATLKNAKFSLNNSENKSIILLSPNSESGFFGTNDNFSGGFGVANWSGGSPVLAFYADLNGNVTFSGNLRGATGSFSGQVTASSGYIGGLKITSSGIEQYSGLTKVNYINNDGTARIGGLTISYTDPPTTPPSFTSTFSGKIYATSGVIAGWQLRPDSIISADNQFYFGTNGNLQSAGLSTGRSSYNGRTYTYISLGNPIIGDSPLDSVVGLTGHFRCEPDSTIDVVTLDKTWTGVTESFSVLTNATRENMYVTTNNTLSAALPQNSVVTAVSKGGLGVSGTDMAVLISKTVNVMDSDTSVINSIEFSQVDVIDRYGNPRDIIYCSGLTYNNYTLAGAVTGSFSLTGDLSVTTGNPSITMSGTVTTQLNGQLKLTTKTLTYKKGINVI